MITDQQLLQAESEAAIALVRANQVLEQTRVTHIKVKYML
jgi:hypothetical protein